MGLIAKAMAGPSAAAAKRSGVFEDVIDRIDGALLHQDLDEVERWLEDNSHTFPSSWQDLFNDRIEVKREEIASEDVGNILHSRFNF